MATKKKPTKAERQAKQNKHITGALARGDNMQAMLYQATAMPFTGDHEIQQPLLMEKLVEQATAIASGDTEKLTYLLASQVQTLNAMFTKYGVLACENKDLKVVDTCAKIALRAQSQCRATAEAISAIQNPPHATFMTQNNISNGAPQQVNNGKPQGVEQQQADPITKSLNAEQPEALPRG